MIFSSGIPFFLPVKNLSYPIFLSEWSHHTISSTARKAVPVACQKVGHVVRFYLRLVKFTSDGVVRALMTWWKSKIGVVSGVISATESESEESERFHFFRLRVRLRRLRSAYDLVKPVCRSRKQKQKDKPITIHVPTLCDWFCMRLWQPSFHLIVNDGVVSGIRRIRTLFSPDRKVLRFWLRLRLRIPRLWKPACSWFL